MIIMSTLNDNTISLKDFLTWKSLWLALDVERHVGQRYTIEETESILDKLRSGVSRAKWEAETMFNPVSNWEKEIELLPEYARILSASETLVLDCKKYSQRLLDRRLEESLRTL